MYNKFKSLSEMRFIKKIFMSEQRNVIFHNLVFLCYLFFMFFLVFFRFRSVSYSERQVAYHLNLNMLRLFKNFIKNIVVFLVQNYIFPYRLTLLHLILVKITLWLKSLQNYVAMTRGFMFVLLPGNLTIFAYKTYFSLLLS